MRPRQLAALQGQIIAAVTSDDGEIPRASIRSKLLGERALQRSSVLHRCSALDIHMCFCAQCIANRAAEAASDQPSGEAASPEAEQTTATPSPMEDLFRTMAGGRGAGGGGLFGVPDAANAAFRNMFSMFSGGSTASPGMGSVRSHAAYAANLFRTLNSYTEQNGKRILKELHRACEGLPSNPRITELTKQAAKQCSMPMEVGLHLLRIGPGDAGMWESFAAFAWPGQRPLYDLDVARELGFMFMVVHREERVDIPLRSYAQCVVAAYQRRSVHPGGTIKEAVDHVLADARKRLAKEREKLAGAAGAGSERPGAAGAAGSGRSGSSAGSGPGSASAGASQQQKETQQASGPTSAPSPGTPSVRAAHHGRAGRQHLGPVPMGLGMSRQAGGAAGLAAAAAAAATAARTRGLSPQPTRPLNHTPTSLLEELD